MKGAPGFRDEGDTRDEENTRDEGNTRIQGCFAAQKLHTRAETCPDFRRRKTRTLQCLGMGTQNWGCHRGVSGTGALQGGSSSPIHPGTASAALKRKHKKISDGFDGLGPGVTPGCLGVSSSASSSPCATTEDTCLLPGTLGTPALSRLGTFLTCATTQDAQSWGGASSTGF